MVKTLRVAVIGAGHISQFHLQGYARCPNVCIAGVVDIDLERARARAEPYGCMAYDRTEHLLATEELDAVSICTPPQSHYALAKLAIEKDLHILCEKPLAVDVAEARQLVSLAQQGHGIFMTAFCHRFVAAVRHARRLILAGRLGRLHMFRCRFADRLALSSPWYTRRETGGGVFKESMVHSVDLFRWLIGDVKRIGALTGFGRQDMTAEDSGAILLESTSGVVGIVEGSFATPCSENKIEIYGSEGAIIVDYNTNTNVYRSRYDDVQPLESDPDPFRRFEREIEHFVECARSRTVPEVTAEDGLRALELVDAAILSDETGQIIDL